MAQFVYTARDAQGRLFQGVVEGDSQGAAVMRLRSQGYLVTSLRPQSASAARRAAGSAGRTAPARSLAVFCRQFATLVQAGVPVTNALRICGDQADTAAWRDALTRIRLQVEKGDSLSAAFGAVGRFFPPLVASMIEAGELSGTLDESFAGLAVHFEKEHDLRQKVIGALIYPVIVVFVAAVVITVLLLFVLPNFLNIFQSSGITLPWPARALLALGRFVKAQGLWALLLVVAGAAGAGAWFGTPRGRSWRDYRLLRLPIFGRLAQNIEVTRTARTLATMLKSGIPALSALRMSAGVVGNVHFRRALEETAEAVRGGASLAQGLGQTKMFPGLLVQMVEVGESTGTVDSMLSHVAGFFEQEAENRVKGLTTALEPAIMLVVGVIVAFIVASVMLPMFEMATAMTH
ncbi:MAG: type II secretion system F family protein [Bacillota bacterium]|nr:type II secretion system F family protein [Bacillota bacterium]